MEKQVLSLKNLTLYRGDEVILKDVSWEITDGDHWALLGPNGSGKTTLLNIVSGNLWPSRGEVSVLGKQFGKTDLRELRKHIGWVTTFLTERVPQRETALRVVLSGKYASFGIYEKIDEEDREKAKSLLQFMDCSYVEDRSFRIISQGERQKVLIARALMADPALMVLDEPCTGLDVKARRNLLASISRICREKETTVIYVTHHFEEIIPEIDKAIMLKEGRVFAKGRTQEVLSEQIIEELFK
ncbi:MAG: molybdenum ABC transporter ATP-binding protein [Spirochaetes bacterium]|nr:MAG: molybdenum ABC transporter ATP-binding protein [Spirochaetota bacterium]